MKDELYKALSKGYADRCDQLNAVYLIEELQVEVERLRGALRTMVYETTHLSPEEDDGSHWCSITADALQAARAALAHGEADQ